MKSLQVFLIVLLVFGIAGCSSAPSTSSKDVAVAGSAAMNARKLFQERWQTIYRKVQVMQVAEVQEGWYRGNGIVDEHPIEEFYDANNKVFSVRAPSGKEAGPMSDSGSKNFKGFVTELASQMAIQLKDDARIAVVAMVSDQSKSTALSRDLLEKIEMQMVESGKIVVDRATIEKVFAEHKFQQGEGAFFDTQMLAKIGKMVGATVVVHGTYSMADSKELALSIKAVSVESGRVLSIKQGDFNLTGAGAAEREKIIRLAQ